MIDVLIPLHSKKYPGKVARIDAEDYPLIKDHRWYPMRRPNGKWYAVSTDGRTLMHRLILGLGPDAHVDHKNNDGLDNRRENIRPASRSQNGANRRVVWGKSGYKGVRETIYGTWIAYIGGRRHIGTYTSPKAAAIAYDLAARELYGEFAATNESLGLVVHNIDPRDFRSPDSRLEG